MESTNAGREYLSRADFVVLDADGTIFDSMQAYQAAFFSQTLHYFGNMLDGHRRDAIEFYLSTSGMPLNAQFANYFVEKWSVSVPAEKIQKMVDGFFEETGKTDCPVFRDAQMLLHYCSRLGKDIFVTSGTRTDILEARREKHLGGFLPRHHVIGSDVIPKGLGHIEVFARIKGVPRQHFAKRAILIGDGPGDMLLARQADVFPVGLVRTETLDPAATTNVVKMISAGAEITVRSLTELIHKV